MRKPVALLASALLLQLAASCGGDSKAAGDAGPIDASAPLQTVFGGERPVELRVPDGYDGSEALPLIVVLHGYGATGLLQYAYSRLGELVNDQNVLVMAPDGLTDPMGNQYWNATAACCDFEPSGVDDASYILGLINEVSRVYEVDPKRVHLWGHSNGGFMAYRMACDHADVIASIVSLAGAMHLDPADCSPSEPVNILQIQGDADATILYEGGMLCLSAECRYPSTEASVDQWAIANGCASDRTTSPTRVDLDNTVDGDETRIEQQDGCPAGGNVELWVVEGGGHIPVLRSNFDDLNWEWFQANPKP